MVSCPSNATQLGRGDAFPLLITILPVLNQWSRGELKIGFNYGTGQLTLDGTHAFYRAGATQVIPTQVTATQVTATNFNIDPQSLILLPMHLRARPVVQYLDEL